LKNGLVEDAYEEGSEGSKLERHNRHTGAKIGGVVGIEEIEELVLPARNGLAAYTSRLIKRSSAKEDTYTRCRKATERRFWRSSAT
jgi:hypothetical protein